MLQAEWQKRNRALILHENIRIKANYRENARFALTEFFLEFIRGVCYIIDTKEETTAHKVVDLTRLDDKPTCSAKIQGRLIYFRLFLLSRKASNAITKLPKAISRANIPMKIEMISKAVICATSPLMYSGKPGMKFWEATTLQHDCSSPIFYHILSSVTISY